MPVIYSIDSERKVIRTKCVGSVTLDEVTDHFRALERDPNCPDQLDVLLDLSELTSLPQSGQFSAVVDELKKLQDKVRLGAFAIVATRDVVFGMLRMFEVMAQRYFRVIQIFRVMSEAEAWLISERVRRERCPDG